MEKDEIGFLPLTIMQKLIPYKLGLNISNKN